MKEFLSILLNRGGGGSSAWLDYAEPWQLGFQDPASPIIEGIIDFHYDVMFVMVVLGGLVGWVMLRTMVFYSEERHPNPEYFQHGTTLEILWTFIPSLILVGIAVPSFALLYAIDEMVDPAITLKVMGRQWYWSYEYSDYTSKDGESLVFDSYMIAEDDLEAGQLRLLEVDNRVVLPTNTHIRVLVTAADVLHCWGIPSLAMKMDCVPGRLNQVSLFINREGVYFGQCSEICGTNHGFMPIVVEAVPVDKYVTWVASQEEFSDWAPSEEIA